MMTTSNPKKSTDMNWLNEPSSDSMDDYPPEYSEEFSGDNQDFPYFSVPETESVEQVELPSV
jgi:hypothetical protein